MMSRPRNRRRRTGLAAWTIGAPLLVVLHAAGAPTAFAQAQQPSSQRQLPPDGAARAALEGERVRVRAELDRVNAEIDALKREDRGMRNDYRLRARLADAEALARRLTDIDARLGRAPAAAATAPARIGAEPTLAPTDGPAEMEAKADILADQARRIVVEAAALDQRAQQMRARQDLRRRVGLMEHDPFSPIEGSKRRVIAGAATTHTPSSTSDSSGPNTTPAANPGVGGASGATFTPGMTGSTAPGGGGTPVQTTIGGARGAVAPPAAPTPAGGSGAADGTPLSVQLRDVLDPATLGELRRLESSGAPRAGVEALERAAAALKARADKLQAQSQSLRAHAHDPR
jgi:hypothetical protein